VGNDVRGWSRRGNDVRLRKVEIKVFKRQYSLRILYGASDEVFIFSLLQSLRVDTKSEFDIKHGSEVERCTKIRDEYGVRRPNKQMK